MRHALCGPHRCTAHSRIAQDDKLVPYATPVPVEMHGLLAVALTVIGLIVTASFFVCVQARHAASRVHGATPRTYIDR